MDTKLRNKSLITWLLLLIYGLYGLFATLNSASQYTQTSYFKTEQFYHEFQEFISVLDRYEINYFTKDALKKLITVSPEEITEHRERHGTLSQQVQSIKKQYESKIQEAIKQKQNDIAEIYTKERDTKIEDIKKNFTDDKHVENKIRAEKERWIDDNYQAYFSRPEFLDEAKKVFAYYLMDEVSGTVYTNIPNETSTTKTQIKGATSISEMEKIADLLYKIDWPTNLFSYPSNNYLKSIASEMNPNFESETDADTKLSLLYTNLNNLKGFIGVVKNPPETNNTSVAYNYKNYFKMQMIYLFIFVTSIFALLIAAQKMRKIKWNFSYLEKLRGLYEKLPIDLRIILFAMTTCMIFRMITHAYLYFETQILVLEIGRYSFIFL